MTKVNQYYSYIAFNLAFFVKQVRGAPAIGIAALLSLAVELFHKDVEHMSPKELGEWTGKNLDYLVTSRPTGVNLRIECSSLKGNFVSLTQRMIFFTLNLFARRIVLSKS